MMEASKKPLSFKGGVGVGESAGDGVLTCYLYGVTHPPAPSLEREGEL
jgi:hypothetical protein